MKVVPEKIIYRNAIVLTLVLISSWAFSQSELHFEDFATQYGINAIIQSQEMGSGLSTFDFNSDGLDDITLCNDGQPVFYQNSLSGFEELPIDLQINNSFTKHVL